MTMLSFRVPDEDASQPLVVFYRQHRFVPARQSLGERAHMPM